jgi:CHAT domain-containing protein
MKARSKATLVAAQIWLAVAMFTVSPNAVAQEATAKDEGKAAAEFDAEVARLLALIESSRQKNQWQESLVATDQLENLFDENEVWPLLDAIDARSIRRNIAMWRADALIVMKRALVAKAQYEIALEFNEGSNDDGEIAKYLKSQLEQLAPLDIDQYALKELDKVDKDTLDEDQKTNIAQLEKMMGHLSEVRKAYTERRWTELEYHAGEIENFFENPKILAESDPDDLEQMKKYIALFRADAAIQLGRFDRAEEQYGIAIGLFLKTEPDSLQTITTKMKLSALYREQGRTQEALSIVREIEPQYREKFPTDTVNFASFVMQLGEVYFVVGSYDESEKYFREALTLYEKARDPIPMDTEMARVSLGKAYVGQGRWSEAESTFNRALTNLKPIVGDNHDHVAIALSGLVTIYIETGRGADAEPLARRALAIFTRTKGTEHPGTTRALSNLALSLVFQNQLTDAEAYLRQALAGAVRTIGNHHQQTAQISSNLGMALMRQERFDEALIHLTNARDWLEAALGANHPEIPVYQNNIAATLMRLKRFPEAAEMAEDSIRKMEKLLGAGHPKTAINWANFGGILFLGEQDRNRAVEAFDRALQIAEATPGEPGRAVIESLTGIALVLGTEDATSSRALSAGRRAVALMRQQRARQQDSKSLAQKVSAIGMDTAGESMSYGRISYALLIKLLSERIEDLPEEHSLHSEEIFNLAQDFKRSGSARAMAQTAARTASGTGDLARIVRRQQDLSRQLVANDAEFEKALVSGDLERTNKLAKLTQEVATRLDSINEQLDREFPEYAELINPDPLTIEKVQSRLGKKDALLLFHTGFQDVTVFAVTAEQVRWISQSGIETEVKSKIERLRCQIDPQGCAENYFADEEMSDAELEGYRPYDRDAAYYLYQQLVEPIEQVLNGKDHIYVVSSGELATLPLAALVSEKPVPGDDADPDILANTQWLGEQYAFTSLPAVAALRGNVVDLRQNGSNNEKQDWDFAGFGAPKLDGPDSNDGQVRGVGSAGFFRAAGGQGLSLADPASLKKLIPLPGTDRELEAMAAALNAGNQSIVTGVAATETAVRTSGRLADSEVVIFATHGLLPEELDGLAEPALVFTPPEQASVEDDGVLSASEAAELDISARWVILSACNTASASGQGGGDSLSSLSRAFLYAGAKSLLASNWRVGDEETAVLTVETIKANRAAPDQGRAKALQYAMEVVRSGKRADGTSISNWKPEWAHPASWAPFVHISNAP